MKRKRGSPSKSKQKNEDHDIKTTFFSKWGRKNKANKDGKKNTDQIDSSDEEDDSDSSASDIEMHPYMTRSKPIIARDEEDKHKVRSSKSRRKKRDLHSEEENESSANENVEIGQPPKSPSSKHKPMHTTPRRAKAPPPPLLKSNLKGNLISELKGKIGEPRDKFDSPLPTTKMNDDFLGSTNYQRGPNFFVGGSPQKTGTPGSRIRNRVTVTSNGWSGSGDVGGLWPNPERRKSNPNSEKSIENNERDLLYKFQQDDEILIPERKGKEVGKASPRFNSRAYVDSGTTSRLTNVVPLLPPTSGRDSQAQGGDGGSDSDDPGSGSETESEPESLTMVQKPKRKSKVEGVTRAFARSDDNRKGFRSWKSSHSLSDEEDNDGHQIGKNTSVFFLFYL